jgi:RNA polymerase sigma-70 factor (sigma-E family)
MRTRRKVVMVEEPDGFARWVAESSRALLQTGWLLTGDWSLAQDLVQTALAKTWPRWNSMSTPEAGLAYVRRVMFTTFLAWRGRRWVGEIPTADLPARPADTDPYASADLADLLRSALTTLPAKQRAVVVLRYFLDLSEAATAQTLGCSIATVKTHNARALSALRQLSQLRDFVPKEMNG